MTIVFAILIWLTYCTLANMRRINPRVYCFGGGSSSSTSNPVTNEQAAAQSGVAVGAGSSGVTVTYSDASPDAIALAQHAVDTATATQQQALTDTATAITTSAALAAQTVNNAIVSNTDVTEKSLKTVSDAISANQTAFANLTAQAIQSALQIAGNAAPQTPAAQAEIVAGNQPIGTSVTGAGATTPTTTTATSTGHTLDTLLIISALLIGAYIFTKHKTT